jgi:hypothetical protein
MGVSWLVVPTLVYAFLTYNGVNTLALCAIAGGLKFAQSRPEVPAEIRPYLPLLHTGVVFVFLGGNIVIAAAVAIAALVAFNQFDAVVTALGPWWQIQQRISIEVRRLIAIAVSLILGYLFGSGASGTEWTSTLISVVGATVVTFLLMYTPPTERPTGSGLRGGLI